MRRNQTNMLGSLALHAMLLGASAGVADAASRPSPTVLKQAAGEKPALKEKQAAKQLPRNLEVRRALRRSGSLEKAYRPGTDAKVEGTLFRFGDEDLVLARPIRDEKHERELLRLGMRRVKGKKDVGHLTIFESNYYTQLAVDRKGFFPQSLESKTGQRVALTLRRDQAGRPVVVEGRLQR